MRWIVRGLGALFVLVLLVLGGLWWRMDALAERLIEREASATLGVETTLGGLLLRPLSGILTLRELEIANPPGYEGSFLVVERARGELDVSTLRSELIEVSEVALTGVALTLEQSRGGSNYDAILANLERPAPKPAAAEPAGPAVRVRELVVRDITAQVRLAPAPPLSVEIPAIALTDLGGPGGASAGEITAEVVRAVLTATATRAPGLPRELTSRLLRRLPASRATSTLRGAGERSLDALRGLLRPE
jgi:hypothetical protein